MSEKALEMAREIRRGEADHSPSELYEAAAGDKKLYAHAMREAGYVVQATGRAPAVCETCGFEFGADKGRTPVAEGGALHCWCGRPSMYLTGECEKHGVRFK